MPTEWTENKVAFLRRHHGTLGWTCAKIAAQLGPDVTEDAVRRKAGKLGLKVLPHVRYGRSALETSAHVERETERAIQVAASRTFDDGPFEDRRHSVSFDRLQPCHCRWPLGSRPYRYCGRPRDLGATQHYCAEHIAISMGRGTPSERRAHEVGPAEVAA